MTDVAIVATNVVAGTDSKQVRGIAGAAIAAGKLVARDPATKKFVLADTNHATIPELKEPEGVALHAAENNQPLTVLTAGDLTVGTVLTAGTDYWASDTPGGICPRADVGSTERVVQVGIAKTNSVLAVNFQRPGVTL